MRTSEANERQKNRRDQMRAWRFGDGQTFGEEGREIAAAQAAGLESEYVDGQRRARMRAASKAQRGGRRRQTRERLRSGRHGRRELVADLVIEAAMTRNCAWTSTQLASWGVAWPPPKGWRRRLVTRWAASENDEGPASA